MGVDGGGKEAGEKEWEEGFEKRLGKCFWVVGEVKENGKEEPREDDEENSFWVDEGGKEGSEQ